MVVRELLTQHRPRLHPLQALLQDFRQALHARAKQGTDPDGSNGKQAGDEEGCRGVKEGGAGDVEAPASAATQAGSANEKEEETEGGAEAIEEKEEEGDDSEGPKVRNPKACWTRSCLCLST